MFLRRLLKSSQISSSVGRIRTISSSPNVTTPPTPSTSEFVGRSTFRKVAETIAPSVVNIYAPNDDLYGSGILFGEGDKIITCGHVVRNFHKFRTSSVYRSKTIEKIPKLRAERQPEAAIMNVDYLNQGVKSLSAYRKLNMR